MKEWHERSLFLWWEIRKIFLYALEFFFYEVREHSVRLFLSDTFPTWVGKTISDRTMGEIPVGFEPETFPFSDLLYSRFVWYPVIWVFSFRAIVSSHTDWRSDENFWSILYKYCHWLSVSLWSLLYFISTSGWFLRIISNCALVGDMVLSIRSYWATGRLAWWGELSRSICICGFWFPAIVSLSLFLFKSASSLWSGMRIAWIIESLRESIFSLQTSFCSLFLSESSFFSLDSKGVNRWSFRVVNLWVCVVRNRR